MIIGIDASRANRSHKTGTEWYSYYLIRWLAKIDKENQYILFTDTPLTDGLVDLTTTQYVGENQGFAAFDRDGYQILKSPFDNFKAKVLKWPYRYFWTQGRLSLEMLKGKVDFLFVPAHTLPLIHPRKTLVTIHDVGFERDRRLYRNEGMGPESGSARHIINLFVKIFTLGKYSASSLDYLSWSTVFALKHATSILTVSNFSKQEIIDVYHAGDKRIEVVYNGYNKLLYAKKEQGEESNSVLCRYGIKSPYFLYVGRLERKKNTPALIEAFAAFKQRNKDSNHKLVLVGDASFGYDEVKYIIHEHNIENDVLMPGWIEESDMPYVYSSADAFVFPSRYEGFGIPLLQAMACEIPIACSNASSIPEVAGDAGLYFDPANINSMADAMDLLVKDEAIRRKLIGKGRERIQEFSWEKTARETLKIILSL